MSEIGFGNECRFCGHSFGILIGNQTCPNCGKPLTAMSKATAPKITANAVCPKGGYRVGMLIGDPVCGQCGERLPEPA
jgi:DNA-directed RNA polymerase subunit RPC12/RpoP